jgi:hypothetical protein
LSAEFSETDGQALVELLAQDGDTELALCSSAAHIGCIFGTNEMPYPLPALLRIGEGRALKIKLSNLINDVNVLRLCVRSGQDANVASVDKPSADAMRQRLTYPFFCVPDGGCVALTPLQQVDITLTLDGDADFRLKQISGLSDGAYRINIIDANSGEGIVLGPSDTTYRIDSGMMVGTRTYPWRLRVPRTFMAGQKLILSLEDVSGQANTVWLALAGEKIVRGAQ